MKPIYFEDGEAFRGWLRAHHATATEVWVGYHKVATKKKSMTWSESVDEALCYGWIDGIRKSVDEGRYSIRFTPRKPTSRWSKVNLKKVEALIARERMREAGMAAYEKRSSARSGTYAYENERREIDAEMRSRLLADEAAWAFFTSQPAGYQKTSQFWVMSAKKGETRERRFLTLLECSREGEKIPLLRR